MLQKKHDPNRRPKINIYLLSQKSFIKHSHFKVLFHSIMIVFMDRFVFTFVLGGVQTFPREW